MVHSIPDILARIVETKRSELSDLARRRPELEQAAAARPAARDFAAALRNHPPAIIAEIKKASPSKGVLLADYHPSKIAKCYAEGGADALSVLTDRDYFQGKLADLEEARAAVPLPALRKDFTVEPLHILEAAAHGADAILLIAAILEERQLRDLRELAARHGMASIIEVHDGEELQRAIGSGAAIIGVNNRDLRTFQVSLHTSLELAERIPEDVIKVAESGIQSRADVERLSGAGYRAFLVGEHLMRSGDPVAALRELRGCGVRE